MQLITKAQEEEMNAAIYSGLRKFAANATTIAEQVELNTLWEAQRLEAIYKTALRNTNASNDVVGAHYKAFYEHIEDVLDTAPF